MNKIKLFATMVVTAGALFTLQAPVSAQVIGFKVGPTWSKIAIDPKTADTEFDNLMSFGGGGFVRAGLMGLSLQIEALAVTKGGQQGEASTGQSKIKLQYLEVPVLARFGLGSNAMFSPYIMVGPALSFELSCKVSFESAALNDDSDCEDPGESEDRKKMDVGATGVLGLEFKAGPGHLFVEGRYNHGFINLNESTTDTEKVKNRMFAAMAGYSITLK